MRQELGQIDTLWIISASPRQSTYFYLSLYVKGRVVACPNFSAVKPKGRQAIIAINREQIREMAGRTGWKLCRKVRQTALYISIGN